MKSHYYCSQCLTKQVIRTCELATEKRELREEAVIECMKFLGSFNLKETPSYFASQIQKIIREITGNSDPYRIYKERSTEFAEKMIEKLSIDSIEKALRAALTANSIDYGGDKIIEYKETFEEMMKAEIAVNESEKLFKEIEKAEKIVYFFDNAGEAVFDKKFIDFFEAEVIAVGKRSPMFNDITVSELKKMGFENVMDCGDNTGVLRIDKKLEKELKAADVIISKGQANFESLPELWNGVYYLFKVKCRPMSEYLSIPIGSDMVMKI